MNSTVHNIIQKPENTTIENVMIILEESGLKCCDIPIDKYIKSLTMYVMTLGVKLRVR